MIAQLKSRNSYAMMLLDLLSVIVAAILAFVLRFEFEFATASFQLWQMLYVAVPLKMLIFFCFRLYSGMYRYFGIRDALNLTQAVFASSVLLIIAMFLIYRLEGFSRSVFVFDGFITLIALGGVRFFIRLYYSPAMIPSMFSPKKKDEWNVLIIGAGSAGEKLLREMYDNAAFSNYRVVGFLDDDTDKQGKMIHGIKILGNIDALSFFKDRNNIKEVLIAVPSATSSDMKRIVSICKSANVNSKTLPSLGEIISGKVSLKLLRDVSYEDLLGRESIDLDNQAIAEYIGGQTVLVTGAGGSIGSELCRRILEFQPRLLLLLDASEENLFKLEHRLKQEFPEGEFLTILGSVVNTSLLEKVYGKYTPKIVFHAAAYKHVPMVERNSWEAVFNNIQGTRNAMELAVKHGVQTFVLVSTDKAVRPTNVMGASKRVTEMLMGLFSDRNTKFIAVRFGNVMGSSGSVVPLFREQISRGGPVTVTHPDVTRYFMTIGEAAQLIIQAGALGDGGEIFILKMGRAVKIVQMAEDLIRLSGKDPHKEIKIAFTGLREGEKLYEELITEGENIVPTKHDQIMVLRDDETMKKQHGGHDGYHSWLTEKISELYQSASAYDAVEIKARLKEIVGEYEEQQHKSVL